MHKPSSIISGYDDKQQILQSDRIMVRVMIPTRMAGSVIGKGGQQVKQMRADYGTQIIIPESSGEERLIKCHVLVPQSDDFTGFQNDATEQLKAHEDGLRRCCLVIKRLAEFLQGVSAAEEAAKTDDASAAAAEVLGEENLSAVAATADAAPAERVSETAEPAKKRRRLTGKVEAAAKPPETSDGKAEPPSSGISVRILCRWAGGRAVVWFSDVMVRCEMVFSDTLDLLGRHIFAGVP